MDRQPLALTGSNSKNANKQTNKQTNDSDGTKQPPADRIRKDRHSDTTANNVNVTSELRKLRTITLHYR